MKRREALELTATIIGGSIVGSGVFLSGCTVAKRGQAPLSEEDVRLLDDIGETILPESDTSPGAKAAHIGEFMRTMVRDCYDEQEASIFMAGLAEVREASQAAYSRSLQDLSSDQRQDLLAPFDRIARSESEGEQVHFFAMMKQLTIWGYFTSEPGVTKALRYNPVPGRYDGCVEYAPGETAWA